jgi:hypothetical protein
VKTFLKLTLLATVLAAATDVHAVCGDVTGDGEKTTSDALAVLKSSVGQNVDLVCIDDTPSRIAFYNDIDCNTGSDVSQLRFIDSDENYTFNADPGETTAYQTVDDTQIDNIEIDLCGDEYTFGSPFNLAPNHSYTLFLVLIDPDVYGEEGLAYAILYDDGIPVEATSAALSEAGAEPAWIIGGKK